MNPLDINPRFYYASINISALDIFLFFKKKFNIELMEDQINSVGWELENNIERYIEPEYVLNDLTNKLFEEKEMKK